MANALLTSLLEPIMGIFVVSILISSFLDSSFGMGSLSGGVGVEPIPKSSPFIGKYLSVLVFGVEEHAMNKKIAKRKNIYRINTLFNEFLITIVEIIS